MLTGCVLVPVWKTVPTTLLQRITAQGTLLKESLSYCTYRKSWMPEESWEREQETEVKIPVKDLDQISLLPWKRGALLTTNTHNNLKSVTCVPWKMGQAANLMC